MIIGSQSWVSTRNRASSGLITATFIYFALHPKDLRFPRGIAPKPVRYSQSGMSTLKQIQANRLNATKSTGPRTAEGKSATRLNALKHGLFAHDLVIPGEDPAHLEALRTSHYDRFQPATTEEHVLVAALVRNAWRLERCSNSETAVWVHSFDQL